MSLKGIVSGAREERRKFKPLSQRHVIDQADEANQNAKILDLTIIKGLLSKVIEFHTTKEEKASEYRKFTQIWEVSLQNILGYVDEPTWVFMIEAYIEWCIECKEAVQPNGKWEVFDYEVIQERKVRRQNRTVGKKANGKAESIELKTPYDVLVDIKNEVDMAYEMGRPSTRKDSFDPRMMKEMMRSSSSSAGQDNLEKINAQDAQIKEQSKLIEELKADQRKAAAEQAKTNDLMAALLSEIKEQKSSRTSGRRKS